MEEEEDNDDEEDDDDKEKEEEDSQIQEEKPSSNRRNKDNGLLLRMKIRVQALAGKCLQGAFSQTPWLATGEFSLSAYNVCVRDDSAKPELLPFVCLSNALARNSVQNLAIKIQRSNKFGNIWPKRVENELICDTRMPKKIDALMSSAISRKAFGSPTGTPKGANIQEHKGNCSPFGATTFISLNIMKVHPHD
eukprot:Gb_18138 [translate_table: standard]